MWGHWTQAELAAVGILFQYWVLEKWVAPLPSSSSPVSFLCLSWQSYCILLRQLLQVGRSCAPLNYLCSRLELSLSFLLRTNLFILVPELQDFYVQHIYRPLCNQQGIFVVDILDGHYFLSLHHEILAQVEVISVRRLDKAKTCWRWCIAGSCLRLCFNASRPYIKADITILDSLLAVWTGVVCHK